MTEEEAPSHPPPSFHDYHVTEEEIKQAEERIAREQENIVGTQKPTKKLAPQKNKRNKALS